MRPPLPDSAEEGVPSEDSHVETVSEIVSEYLDTMLCGGLSEDTQQHQPIETTVNKRAKKATTDSARETKSKTTKTAPQESQLEPQLEPQLEIISEKRAVSDQATLTSSQPAIGINTEVDIAAVSNARPIDSVQAVQPQPRSQLQSQPEPQSQPKPEIEKKASPQPWDLMELEWLLVAAGRLNLALPLIGLDSVQAFDKKVTPFSSGLDWLPGLARVKNTNIRLVDIASFLMGTPSDLSNTQNIIILNNGNWGLLVDNIVTTMRIPMDQVQQTRGSKRFRWRHGILIDPVYTMVDPLGLGDVLERSVTKSI
ncbi:MAG: chemotaxis protein CheW [Gammaproteobacteria bacterium]|nr:chemotaxis protein CheW [Gammaproteobacteria bacterium]